LSIALKAQSGFYAWGNYDIGFGEPNGAVALTEQLQGKVAGYPLVVDGVGAGSSGGNYAFVLTGKVNMGDDVAGAGGAPATNFYSIAPNAYARKEGDASVDYAAKQAKKPSGGEVSASKEPEAQETSITQDQILQSQAAAVSSAEAVKKSVASSDSKAYGTAEFSYSNPNSAQIGESFKDIIEKLIGNRFEGKRKAVQKMIDIMSDPAHALLDEKLAKVSQKVNSKIDTLLVRIDVAIDDKVGLVFNSIKGKVISLVPEKDKLLRSSIASLADRSKEATADEIKRSLRSSVTKNITEPLTHLIEDTVTAKLSIIIKEEIGSVGFDLEAGTADAEFKGNVGKALERIIGEIVSQLDVQKLTSTITKTGEDAIMGINLDAVFKELASQVASEAAKGLAEAAANRLLGSATEKLGPKLPVNMKDLADKLAKGDIKGALLAFDPIEVSMNTNFVSLQGWLKFTPEDPVYGNIFRGDISINVKQPKPFAFSGVYINGRKDNSAYWFCQLTGGSQTGQLGKALSKEVVKMDNPVDMGPVQIIGIIGRLWYRMVEDPSSGIVPDATKSYGAYLHMVLFDKAGSGTNIRLDIAAQLQIDNSGDYEVEFFGNGQIKSKTPLINKIDATAMVNVVLSVYYNSKEDHFLANTFVAVKQGVCASGRLIVELKPGYFRVWIGDEPLADRIKITPGCVGWGGQGWVKIDPNFINVGLAISISAEGSVGFNVSGFSISVAYSAGVAAGVKAELQYKPEFMLMSAAIFVDIWGNVKVRYSTPTVEILGKKIGGISGSVSLVELYMHGELMVVFNPKPSKVRGEVEGHISVLSMFSCQFKGGFETTL